MSDTGPRQLIYMPDVNVISMYVDRYPHIVAELNGLKARGVRFIVPARTNTEIRNDPDPIRRGAQLAFIRDFGMEEQMPLIGPMPADGPSMPVLREIYFKKFPQLRKAGVSDTTIREAMKTNPDLAKALAKTQSPVSGIDRLQILDAQRETKNQGSSAEVRYLTYEKVAGVGPEGDPGQKRRIALEFGVTLAPESRKMRRISPRQDEGTVFVKPVHIWETSMMLRGKMISNTALDQKGALARPPGTPPVPSAPKGQLRFNGTLGSGLRIAGMVLLELIVKIVVTYLMRRLAEKWQKEIFDKEMKQDVHPRMIADLSVLANRKSIFDLLIASKKAFATVQLKYFVIGSSLAGELVGPSEHSIEDPYTHVMYEKLISISDQKVDPPKTVPFDKETLQGKKIEPSDIHALRHSGERVTYSVELTYSQEEIELYRMFDELIKISRQNFEFCRDVAKEDPSEPLESMRYWGHQLGDFQAGQLKALQDAGPPSLM